MRYHALIPAAGGGTRFGAESPKQYLLLDGKPLLLHAIERLAASLPLHMTYVVLSNDDRWFDKVIGTQERVTVLRCGGKTRAETVRNALDVLPGVAGDDWIVVHDAVRPCIDAASLSRLKHELANDDVGGLLAIPVTSPLRYAGSDKRVVRTESRDGLWRAQTPQMFRYSVLREAFARSGVEHVADEAQAVEALGVKPRLVMGSTSNVKITYPEDLLLAEAVLSAERGT
jgi:2-C-methyl-D-erythritol 4-phosphate cytidylyltransferase